MVNSKTPRRFRANPVELVIFAVISVIFGNSIYKLVYDQQGFHPTALRPMAANPVSEGRAPASVPAKSLASIQMNCEATMTEQTVEASKARFSGPLCGSDAGIAATDSLVKAEITNQGNLAQATVFPLNKSLAANDSDQSELPHFSTDYVPLTKGKNPIHVEFVFKNGHVFKKDFVVTKI